jgi:ATP-dependent Lhr-like helicase
MKRLDEIEDLPSGPASQEPKRPSIWSAIHPKLLELVRSHTSTLIFVNSRRLAERVAGAINELAGEVLVRAHHGSVAAAQRKDIEERLKLGTLRGIVATSSLELGIDMGAVDLVVQIEAPPSVSSGMQRIGRASHHVGGVSAAILFPKFRGDLVACAAIARAMHQGNVERVSYPRNALDVLAQQIVAMVAMDDWETAALFASIRRAAPYADLPRSTFESVLDMLSGRYPSDEFVELRPRITWDRVSHKITAREGAKKLAIVNAGTIPDRGLFGVFMSGAERGARVGELDEEMVFESRAGDTVILGASTWRIDQITHDRVLVSPAPGEPGKMPFWHGDTAGRSSEFGQNIGEMTRELVQLPRPVAYTRLVEDHSLQPNAAENLLRYLEDQSAAAGVIPSDREILIERCRDELGDWRLCVLTPFGSRVHAPWCMAVTARLRAERGLEAETMWSDDGFVVRLPDSEEPLESEMLLPSAAELRDLVLRQLGSTSMFAAKFREAAGRALLLPRRRPGLRAPLWQQRKRAADLLAVAVRYPSFPILLETYRECVRELLDLGSAADVLKKIERGTIRVTTIDSAKPSPYASALLFSYIANYIYEGDAPMAERRAQALSIDQSQLEEILGSTDFRELLDKSAMEEVEAQLQSLDPDYQARHADGLHDLLLKLGDLTEDEIAARSATPEVAASITKLAQTRRVVRVRIAREARFIPVEYAARYRDGLGTPLPPGLPETFLEPSPGPSNDPLAAIVRRFARTHGPFTTLELSARYALASAEIEAALRGLHNQSKLLEGEFRPGGVHREWCDPDVLQQIRRKTLARLRKEVVPAEQHVFARLLARWQGTTAPRRGLDALLDAIENLQCAELIASDLEREILPARVADYKSSDLDALLASGEIVWVGREQLGTRDGRVSLYLAGSLGSLLAPGLGTLPESLSEKAQRILEHLRQQGASFQATIHQALGGGFPNETSDALWELVWHGMVTNDTFFPIRSLLRSAEKDRPRVQHPYLPPGSPGFLQRARARRGADGVGEGRWSAVLQRIPEPVSGAQVVAATAQQLLVRHGIVMRETAAAENVRGGYAAVYPALKTMEESGWIRRGMFVAGMGAAQFATPAAVDMLRSLRVEPERPETIHLAASDPANPYGNLLPWVTRNESEGSADHTMSRAAGANVILVNGRLAAFFRRRNPALQIFLPDDEPERGKAARELAQKLAAVAIRNQTKRSGLLIATINGDPAGEHFLTRFLEESGFVLTAAGLQMRRVAHAGATTPEPPDDGADDDDA